MKNLEQIIKTPPVFLHLWRSKFDVIASFEGVSLTEDEFNGEKSPYANVELWKEDKDKMNLAIEKYKNKNILFASYANDYYDGDAFVLFEEGGVLFEVHGSHCSCHGLEDQWEPEEVWLDELENRLVHGAFGQYGNEFSNELKDFLEIK